MGKNADMNDVVLKVEHLTKHYPIKKGVFSKSDACVHALEDASFEVHRGETFAIVGESGCGKSTTGKCILRLTEPTSGEVILDGEDFTKLKGEDLTRARQKMKLIFQDPYSSLNPRMTVADIIAEPIDIAGTYKTRAERDARVEEIMQAVGLDLAFKYRYPHEFSGGQRQRIGIARAIVLEPEIVVCDEPVSALDVSVQARSSTCLRSCRTSLDCLTSSSATTSPWSSTSPTRSWSCTSATPWSWRASRRSSTSPCTPTPRRFSTSFRAFATSASRTRRFCRAMCPVPPTRLRAASSTRAASTA